MAAQPGNETENKTYPLATGTGLFVVGALTAAFTATATAAATQGDLKFALGTGGIALGGALYTLYPRENPKAALAGALTGALAAMGLYSSIEAARNEDVFRAPLPQAVAADFERAQREGLITPEKLREIREKIAARIAAETQGAYADEQKKIDAANELLARHPEAFKRFGVTKDLPPVQPPSQSGAQPSTAP